MITNPKLQAIISLVASIGLILVSLGPAQAQDLGETPEPVTGPSQPDSDSEYQTGTLLVKIRPSVSKMEVDSMLDQYAARAQDSAYSDGAQLWNVPEGGEMALAERLNADPRVEYAEPNYIYRATLLPDDPRLNDQWAHERIKSPGAWDITTGSSQTIIAIIDTGIDRNHPDLQGRIIEGYDFVDGDADPEDGDDHLRRSVIHNCDHRIGPNAFLPQIVRKLIRASIQRSITQVLVFTLSYASRRGY